MNVPIRNVVISTLLGLCPAATFSQEIDLQKTFRESVPYLSRRANFQTVLTKRGPAPLSPRPFETPEGWFELNYPSTNGLHLKAWIYVPQSRSLTPPPGMIYFHGNFALHDYDFKKCQPFVDAGFVVMLPTLRGENKNPGHCEMFFGEVEDAINAVRWLARQKFVDRQQIHTFGHSAGGVISALLSLHESIPVRMGGSSGGLYGVNLFEMIPSKVPFDRTNPRECELRVLPGNIRWMKRPHVAYAGNADSALRAGIVAAEKEVESLTDPKLKIVKHPGNHNTALPDAIRQFILMTKAKS